MFSEETRKKLDDIDKSIIVLGRLHYLMETDEEIFNAVSYAADALGRESDFAIEEAKAEIFNEIYPKVKEALVKIGSDYVAENKERQINFDTFWKESFNNAVTDLTNEMAGILLTEILDD